MAKIRFSARRPEDFARSVGLVPPSLDPELVVPAGFAPGNELFAGPVNASERTRANREKLQGDWAIKRDREAQRQTGFFHPGNRCAPLQCD